MRGNPPHEWGVVPKDDIELARGFLGNGERHVRLVIEAIHNLQSAEREHGEEPGEVGMTFAYEKRTEGVRDFFTPGEEAGRVQDKVVDHPLEAVANLLVGRILPGEGTHAFLHTGNGEVEKSGELLEGHHAEQETEPAGFLRSEQPDRPRIFCGGDGHRDDRCLATAIHREHAHVLQGAEELADNAAVPVPFLCQLAVRGYELPLDQLEAGAESGNAPGLQGGQLQQMNEGIELARAVVGHRSVLMQEVEQLPADGEAIIFIGSHIYNDCVVICNGKTGAHCRIY